MIRSEVRSFTSVLSLAILGSLTLSGVTEVIAHPSVHLEVICKSEAYDYSLICQSMMGPDIHMARGLLEVCKWKSQQRYCGKYIEAVDLNTYMRGEYSVSSSGCADEHNLVQEWCIVDSKEGQWRFDRVGPIVSFGGVTWHQFLAPAFQMFSDWNFSFVTGFFGGSLSADNQLIGYPPIHQHHHHLGEGQVEYISSPFIIHGDDQCLQNFGGPYCYMRSLPPGYGSRLEGPPFYRWHEVNDVREMGSVELSHYIFTALRLPCPTCSVSKPVSQYNLGISGILAPSSGGYHASHLVPAQCESISWNEASFPDSGLLVWAYLHTHQPGVQDMWLLRAPPEAAGLLDSPLVFAKNRALPLFSLPADFKNITATQRWLLSRANHQNARGRLNKQLHQTAPVCSFDHLKAPIEEQLPSDKLKKYYRLSPICQSFTAKKNERVSLVVFYSPRNTDDPNGFVQQHVSLRLWFLFDVERFASRDYCGKC